MHSLLSPLLITFLGACIAGLLDDPPPAAPTPPGPDDSDPATHGADQGSQPTPTANDTLNPLQGRLSDEEVEDRFEEIVDSYEDETAWQSDPHGTADMPAARAAQRPVRHATRQGQPSRFMAGATRVLHAVRTHARKYWRALVAVLAGMKARGSLDELGHQLLDAHNHLRPNPGFA